MELDDNQAEQMAEAVADALDVGSSEERATRVAAAKAKIKISFRASAIKKTVLKK